MPVPNSEAPAYLASDAGVLGKGWTEVDTLEGLDPDEYELEEDEEYITLDLGPEMDPKYLQTEGTYQFIGMDTPLPHLKIGNTILQGQVTPLIGTEIILGLIRNEENPLRPSHPPMYTTDKRISFRPIILERIDQTLPNSTQDQQGDGEGEEEIRPMFLKQPARYGPNAPEKLPGRKRDRDRAARRAERLAAGMEVDKDDEESGDEGMDVDVDTNEPATLESFTSHSITSTPGAGPSVSHRPISPTVNTNLNPLTPIGRPRTRPTIEITSLPELAHLDIAALPPNIRIMVLPHVIHELDPTPSSNDAIHLPKKPLEFTKGQIKKLVNGPSSTKRKIQGRRFEHLAAGEEGASLPSSYSPSTSSQGHEGPMTPTRTAPVLEKVVGFKHRLRDHVEVPQFVVAGEPSPSTQRQPDTEREVGGDVEGGDVEGGDVEGGDVEGGDVEPEMRLDVRNEEHAETRTPNDQRE